jgi:hypothetical protein
MSNNMKVNLKVWRQKNTADSGHFEEYSVETNPDMSFLEMFDVLNENLITDGNVQHGNQRQATWTQRGHHHLSVAHAQFQRWRYHCG